MLKRFAPLVPLSFVVFLAACASQSPESQSDRIGAVPATPNIRYEIAIEKAQEKKFEDKTSTEASGILDLAFSLIGTPYRYGGQSASTGFDCSGFVGYLFRKEAGISLPRSTRELINLDVPLVSKEDLQPGDLLFFNNRGRGRVSHAGIYIGDGQFIHSASNRSGVRVDRLDDRYWSLSYMEAKRVLDLGYQAQNR